MLRIAAATAVAALVAALAIAGAASAKELKPKFGDIGGVYYTEVSQDREACLQAIRNKIALCRQNTSFVSNTMDRKYPGCLPIFRRQAWACVDHFRSEAYKCQGAGSVRIADFTGFSCTVTATVIEEDEEPEGRPAEPRGGGGRAGRNDGVCKTAMGAAERVSKANETLARRFQVYHDAVERSTGGIDQKGQAFTAAMNSYWAAEAAAERAFEGADRGFKAAWRNYKTAADTARRQQKARGKAAWDKYVAARKASSRDRWDALSRAHGATVEKNWRYLMTARRAAMRDLKTAIAARCR